MPTMKDMVIFIAVIVVLAVILWAAQEAWSFALVHLPSKGQFGFAAVVVLGLAFYVGYRRNRSRTK